jgi:LmbE family N-acetylglucosaminyl deacetylase
MDVREQEDDRALSEVGARTERLQLPEALYRRGPDGQPLYDTDMAIFQQESPAPCDFLITVTERIAAQVRAVGPDLVLAPLGIGGHIDHLVVSQAARQLGSAVLYYEDVPYLLYDRCRDWRDNIVGREDHKHISTRQGWLAKIRGIERYRSQAAVLWSNPDTWREDLATYARTIGSGRPGERYWALDER